MTIKADWDELDPEEFGVWRKWWDAEQENVKVSARDQWNDKLLASTVDMDPDARAVMQAGFEAGYLIGFGDAVRGLILQRRDDMPLPQWVEDLGG